MSFLNEIVANRKESIKDIIKNYEKVKKIPKESNLFYKAIKNNKGISIISEVKFASPSMGDIKEKIPVKKIINAMDLGGVVGFSVLTEPNYFKGSPDYISRIREVSKTPILMKDFFLHESQFHFAADLDANMVLIIVAALERDEIERFVMLAKKLNLETLIEVHDEVDLNKILGLDLKIIGINNRNLTDFSIDLNTTKNLIPIIKKNFPNSIIISESGVKTRDDAKFVIEAGADAMLVGTSIMQATDITSKIQELKGETRG